jgi:hypothetical protein
VSGPISVGNIGIIGTAAKGTPGKVEVLSSYADATSIFGPYDSFDAPSLADHELTLVRALELAYANGATTVLAVRVATGTPADASIELLSATGKAAKLTANAPGGFGNKIKIKIEDDPIDAAKAKVTLTYDNVVRVYTGIADGNALVAAINADSAGLAIAAPGDKATERPTNLAETNFAGGADGADAGVAEYTAGLESLLNENAHIIVAAGLPESVIGAALKAHVEAASTDKIKRDRIAVAGSVKPANNATTIKPTQFSDRMVFVAPGIQVVDAAKAAAGADDPSVILPGAYAAPAVAGMLSARDPHVSLTNKTINVIGLETKFTSGQLEQLVDAQVLALEQRTGFRIVKAITTDAGAFRQITTRRIVDYAKFGVRSAAEPYIGLLNNDRVRKALKGSINGFLAGMVDDEMLESYELDVTATRDEEIRGIAKVTMTVRPTFSIDYIKVVMFLG